MFNHKFYTIPLILFCAVLNICTPALAQTSTVPIQKTVVTATSKITKPNNSAKKTTAIDTIHWKAVKQAKGYKVYTRSVWTNGRTSKWKFIANTTSSTRYLRNRRTIPVYNHMIKDGIFESIEYSVIPYNNTGNGTRTISQQLNTVRYFRNR